MFKKLLKKVQGFSPVELVIMVGFAALAAGALIFLATTPHYMAQQPVDVNIKIEGAASVSRTPAAEAQGICRSKKIVKNSLGGFDVTPTNTYPTDVVNVQCAVDNSDEGGTVLLKAGTFAFGLDKSGLFYGPEWETDQTLPFKKGKSTVYVTNSVKIMGDYTKTGNTVTWNTKITGGRPAFHVGWDGDIFRTPEDMNEDTPSNWPGGDEWGRTWIPVSWGDKRITDDYGINLTGAPWTQGMGVFQYFRAYKDIDVTIDGLNSDGGRFGFITAGAGHDLTFTNNKVADLRDWDAFCLPLGIYVLNTAVGLNAGGGLVSPPFYKIQYFVDGWPPSFLKSIDGTVLIDNNTVENIGLNLPQYDTEVTGNYIDIHGFGIAAAFTSAVTTISDNTLTNVFDNASHDAPVMNYPVEGALLGILSEEIAGKVTISGNKVTYNPMDAIRTAGPVLGFNFDTDVINNITKSAWGIFATQATGGRISGNTFETYCPPSTPGSCDSKPLSIGWPANGMTIEGNTILGEGVVGIELIGGASGNTVKNNDLTGFTPMIGYYGVGDGTNAPPVHIKVFLDKTNDNTLEGNTIGEGAFGIQLAYTEVWNGGKITGNSLLNNTFTAASGSQANYFIDDTVYKWGDDGYTNDRENRPHFTSTKIGGTTEQATLLFADVEKEIFLEEGANNTIGANISVMHPSLNYEVSVPSYGHSKAQGPKLKWVETAPDNWPTDLSWPPKGDL